MGRAQCLGQLGSISIERLKLALEENADEDTLLHHFNDAVRFYEAALDLEPADAITNRATSHNQLGIAYMYSRVDQEKALAHFEMASRYFEASGDVFEDAGARLNAAQILQRLSRLHEAREYAREALALFLSGQDTSLVTYVQELLVELDRQIETAQN